MRSVRWLLLAALAACLVGCGKSLDRPRGFVSLGQLNRPDCRVGVLRNTLAARCAEELFPAARVVPYDSPDIAVTALLAGRIEGFATDEHAARLAMRRHPERMAVLEEPLDDEPKVLVFAAHATGLCARAEAFVRDLRASGRYDDMLARWCFDAASSPAMPALETPTQTVGTISFGTSALREPLSYLAPDGTPTGYDVEFARRFARHARCACEVFVMPPETLRQAVRRGRLDCVVDGWCRDEVPDGLPVATNYLDADVRMLVLRTDSSAKDRALADFVSDLRVGLADAFVRDAHWKLVLYGLWVTVWMTVLSAFWGLLLAIPVCALRMSRAGWLRRLAAGYITVLQGTPVLVVLLFLSYVVFAQVPVSGACVAVVTLALWFSAQAAEILRSGIGLVPRGQRDAARVLGFSPVRAFLEIVLPQAIRAMSPVLGTACVNLLHKSSIVGYIAVVDLTMAIDLMCGRNLEALMPLLATGSVYFLLAWLLVRLFDALQRALTPGGRR